jgi:uncharacterized protein YjbJ (UPF0337 family)
VLARYLLGVVLAWTVHLAVEVDLHSCNTTGEQPWGSTINKITGRLKEAVGVITDNDCLKSKGQTDQVVGKVKDKVA